VVGSLDKEDDGSAAIEEGVFLRQLENTMLSSVALRGVQGINRVYLMQHDKVTITKEGSFDS
jgi:DNA-directed RNA polymerase II subunit RPB1